jgi:hypothetical protein
VILSAAQLRRAAAEPLLHLKVLHHQLTGLLLLLLPLEQDSPAWQP